MTDPDWSAGQDDHLARLLIGHLEAERLGEDPYLSSLLVQLPATLAGWLLARDQVLIAQQRVPEGTYTAADLADREETLAMQRHDLDRLLVAAHLAMHLDDADPGVAPKPPAPTTDTDDPEGLR